jgi:hypothetical protein
MCSFLCAWANTSGDMAMALIKPVEKVTPTPSTTNCQHKTWRQYVSRGIRECDRCHEIRPIFDLKIEHQR